MALIKCKECGNDISDSSRTCVHCGAKVVKEIVCPDCKQKNPEDSETCFNCGCVLETNGKSTNTTSTSSNQKKSKIGLFVVLGIVAIVLIIAVLINLNKVKVPYLSNTNKEDANSVLISKGLVPNYIYVYDDYYEDNKVIYTNPDAGSKVKNGEIIFVYVSKGPSYVMSNHSTVHQYHISEKEDDWNFSSPYIKEGVLYIECQVTFAKNAKWYVGNSDNGFGNASINDTFDKTVPVQVIISDENIVAGEEQSFTLEIPISDLDVKKPTSLYLKLVAQEANSTKQFDINVSFSITW